MTHIRIVESVRLVRDRHEHCFKVPLLLVVYVFFLVLFVIRADISNSFDFEEGLLACTGLSGDDGVSIIRDSGLASQNLGEAVYTWLINNFLPRIFRETAISDSTWANLAVSCGSGSAASGSSINVATVGGLRVSQWRRSTRRSCDLGKESLGSLLGSTEFESLCHSSQEALDPTLVPFFGLIDIASENNISEAFTSLPEVLRLKLSDGSLNEISRNEITLAARAQAISPMPPLALGFHSILSPALLELTKVSSRINGLRDSKWIDDNTRNVEVGAVFLNRENSRIALLRVNFYATVGMRVDVSAELRSLPVDPYKQVSSLPWADAFFILLAIVMTISWVYNTFIFLQSFFSNKKVDNSRPISSIPPPEREGQPIDAYAVEGHVNIVSNATTDDRLNGERTVFSRTEKNQGIEFFFWILHGGSSISLISLIILWSLLISELSEARSILVRGKWNSPSGKFIEGGAEFDTMLLHRSLARASLLQADVLLCGISTITFLTLTFLYLFRLQPHLAILGKCIWRGLSDILHLAFVLTVITTAYGVVGHVAFGAQSLEWSSVKSSAWTLSRMFIAWDYSLAPMQNANPALANTFVGTFMFLIANMMVWVWFTIIIETYSAAKVSLKEGGERVPTVVGDVLSGLNSVKLSINSFLLVSENGESSSGFIQSISRLYKSWLKVLHAHNRILDALEEEAKSGGPPDEKVLLEKLALRLTTGKDCGDEQSTFTNLLELLLAEYASIADSSMYKPRLSEHLLSLTDMIEK